MAKTESHIPKLRFSGFSDAWQIIRLGEFCSHFQSGKGITTDDIFEDAQYPVYGGNGLRGYAKTFTHDGLFTLIGRQGALCGNINLVCGKNYISEHAVAVQANEANDTQWLSYLLYLMDLGRLSESSAQPGLAVNKLVRLKINFPSKKEQTKIGDFFQKIDQVIELQQKALTTAQDYKKSMLQKMFPQKGEKVPKVRFDGFSGDWKEDKLSNLGNISVGGDINKDLLSTNATYPVIANGMKLDGIVGYYTTYKINAPAITISGRGDIGFAKARFENFTPIVRLIVFKPSSGDVHFFENAINQIKFSIESTGVPQLTAPQFGSYKVLCTTFSEQRKIGVFFQKLDQQIAQHEKKLESYQSLKKAMLQRMFV